MIINLYYIILGLFVLGAILLVIINARNPRVNARQNWIKYGTYFFLINTIIATAIFFPSYFKIIAIIVVGFGWYELFGLYKKARDKKIFINTFLIFLVLSFSFIWFSFQDKNWILFIVFVVSIFDAFSQLTGQLIGKTKILPKISPNKTVEGSIGGFIFAILIALYLKNTVGFSLSLAVLSAIAISVFAFTGDLLASLIKRKIGVKDFSNLIPGHGGFLDRFDSLIFASIYLFIISILNLI
jgi:phosphatidate cytidylyltransferase